MRDLKKDMDFSQDPRIGPELPRFLRDFGDCSGRSDTRKYLGMYVIAYHRLRNTAAKLSHTRTTIKELSRRGINFHRIRSRLDINLVRKS